MSTSGQPLAKLPLPAIGGERADTPPEELECTRPDAMFFRAQVMAIVRHFFEISCQIGRLPSILGREFFRAKVSHRGIPSFEDQVVFVHDVERALERLNPQDTEVISLVGQPGGPISIFAGRGRDPVGTQPEFCRAALRGIG